jgi:hypothetical protein
VGEPLPCDAPAAHAPAAKVFFFSLLRKTSKAANNRVKAAKSPAHAPAAHAPAAHAPATKCQRLSTPPHFTTDFTTEFTADFATHTGDAPAAHAAAAEWERRSAAAHRSGLLPRAPEAAAPQHLHTQEAACAGLLALLVVYLLYFTRR